MKREREIRECKELLSDESIAHLHIRRRAIVTGFTDDLLADLDDFRVVSVSISEWDYDELMETLRDDLQKELSRLRYYYSKLTSVGATLFGFGASGGVETRPDHTRVSDYLDDVARKTENKLVVYIDCPVDSFGGEFGWIPKLDIPANAALVTDGFHGCDLDGSAEVEVGRLDENQTIEYLTETQNGISEEQAAEIHRIHDGNPVALEIAAEEGSLSEELTGEDLNRLWMDVYDDKITGDEFDLLTESSHLIDLDQRAVTSVTEMTRGRVKEVLEGLERKGVVSKKQSGLFTTDKYVKRYTATQLTGRKLAEQHRMSFKDHVERWVDAYDARMEKMQVSPIDDDDDDQFSPPDFETGLTDPDLYLAVYHLSEIYDDIDRDNFVEELDAIEADTSSLFAFGFLTQRFFFEEPREVLQDLAEAFLGIEEDLDKELFSGTMGVFIDFDVKQFIDALSDGWSADITTDAINTNNSSQPDKVVEKIQYGINSDFFQNLPSDVKVAVARFAALLVTDTRTAREYYSRFGKTAENYGLEEEAFKGWLKELEDLVDKLTPETELDDEVRDDPYEEGYKSLNSEIRDRIELREYLEENHSQTQREFQHRMEKIRDRPDEIADQFIRCGEQLTETENPMFPFLWYSFGHEWFAKIILGGEHWDIYGKYREWAGAREEQEKNLSNEQIVVTKEDIESLWES